MKQETRQTEMLGLIREGRCSNVKEIAQELYISQATARRDLHQLETKGLVKLLYGNIIPLTDGPHDLPLAFRQNQARDSKRILARKAVDMIPNGSTVMMDASSSVLAMTEFIGSDKDLTVFTNCIKTALKLCENSVTVYLIGGRIDNSNFVTSGAWTDTSVNSINVDYFFFSSKAMDENGIISGTSESGVEMRKQMIRCSKNSYFICNAEKIGEKSTFTLCDAHDITGVITDDLDLKIPDVNVISVSD